MNSDDEEEDQDQEQEEGDEENKDGKPKQAPHGTVLSLRARSLILERRRSCSCATSDGWRALAALAA